MAKKRIAAASKPTKSPAGANRPKVAATTKAGAQPTAPQAPRALKLPKAGVEGRLQPRGGAAIVRPGRAATVPAAMSSGFAAPAVVGLSEAATAPLDRVAAVIPPGHQRQSVARPSAYPWCAHVRLLLRLPDDGRAVGTGWLIGPRTVITAGHCVFDGGWMKNIEVKAGGDNSGFETVAAVHFDASDTWVNGSGEARQRADLGVVYLRDPIAGHPGPMRFEVLSDAELRSIPASRISVAGFPSNPFGTYVVDRGALLDVNAPHLLYDVETFRGQSGAPVIFWRTDTEPVVIGVHHFNTAPGVNRAIRIGPAAADLLGVWTR